MAGRRYLAEGRVEAQRALLGLTVGGWEALLRRFVVAVEQTAARIGRETVAAAVGRSADEVAQLAAVARSCVPQLRSRIVHESGR